MTLSGKTILITGAASVSGGLWHWQLRGQVQISSSITVDLRTKRNL